MTAPRQPRFIRRHPSLPNGRTVLGGLLVTIAIVGTFLVADSGPAQPDGAFAVTTRPLAIGEIITADDVTTARMLLTDELRDVAFRSPDAVVGAVVTDDLHSHALITTAHTSQAGSAGTPTITSLHEVSFSVPADRHPPGVTAGDRVTVLATAGDRTDVAVKDTTVLTAEGNGDRSLGGSHTILKLAVADPAAVMQLAHLTQTAELTVVRSTRALGDVWPQRYQLEPPTSPPLAGYDEVPAVPPPSTETDLTKEDTADAQ